MNIYLIAGLGGLCYSVLPIIKQSEKHGKKFSLSGFDWFACLIRILLGFLVIFLYEDSTVIFNKFLAFQVGATAPVLIESIISTSLNNLAFKIKN